MLRHAREAFPNRGFGEVNLVISHRRRLAINQKVQAIKYRLARPEDALRIDAVVAGAIAVAVVAAVAVP